MRAAQTRARRARRPRARVRRAAATGGARPRLISTPCPRSSLASFSSSCAPSTQLRYSTCAASSPTPSPCLPSLTGRAWRTSCGARACSKPFASLAWRTRTACRTSTSSSATPSSRLISSRSSGTRGPPGPRATRRPSRPRCASCSTGWCRAARSTSSASARSSSGPTFSSSSRGRARRRWACRPSGSRPALAGGSRNAAT
mmetsp:Transcript_1047/g.3220  ORF Transcript_1047/g.3220 Transcript_1047/m.3220 type:complete len:201 (-) Transcript_1047:2169-2771(-)